MLSMSFHYISLLSTLIKRRDPSFDARVHYRKGQNVLHNYICVHYRKGQNVLHNYICVHYRKGQNVLGLHNYICVHYRKGQNVLHNYILLSIVNPQSTSADNILNSNFKLFYF